MEAVTNLLTPDQIDAILAVYGTVADWYSQVANYVTTQANIVIEDLWI